MSVALADEEIKQVHKWYYNAKPIDGKLILKIPKYMSSMEMALTCSILDSTAFASTTVDNWTLVREHDTIELRCGIHAFHLDHDTCNVSLYLDGRLSNIGNNGFVTQHYFRNNWAIPMFFGKGHSATGKTPFELGVAVPSLVQLKDALKTLYDNDNSKIQEWFFDKTCHEIDLTNIDIYDQELTKINNAITAKR